MAAINRYQTAAGERWEVRYRKPDGNTSRKRGFTTKRDASTWASKVETSKMEGAYVSPSRGRITVGGLALGWLARQEQGLSPSYYRTIAYAYGKHVEPKWANVPVGKVDSLDVKAWAATMTRSGASATVVNRAVGILAGILDDAVEHRALAFNPARRFKRGEKPQKAPKRHVYLTDADVCRLAEESGRHADLVLVLAFTGLRWGEAIALTVADVEFLKRRISVHSNAVQVGQEFKVGQTKGKENRTVPVAESVLARLAVRCRGRTEKDLLFPARAGGYLKRPSYDSTGWFNRAVERAQVQTITPHDLRHTCASLAVSSGANVLAVSRMLGHKDPSVTLRVYADLFDSDLDAVAVNLDAKISGSVQNVSKEPVDRRRSRSKPAV
ncbi:site-specific integrase [Mycobacteroides abscessus]|uniref:site-specific integrase n=1 Tax=Mycobacteroides abscessus TaxID=36809 RepID=UPI0009A91181|nr:site-specific integrase [Mycobacteroides abscessus]RIU36696.1 site-specific integrase [Mycobacteroides abscessus]SKG27107.1 site-specific recombinase XerD [Mycobacteroides abscessus subsp. massiliense]SKH58611.1 site-specific recombinase XerD [Mycobacteroides abscessus subsp. massiliense]SKH70488.1 site-specific recombinase XerD [Mycobacteroides abscessus subsp. massiliense]SKI42022.1 site-specific recombinase XerD [Mycobacteroides abscessus subsp. massiliense]